MQEHEIIAKLKEWKDGTANGPLGKWVDTVFDGVDVYASAISEQKRQLHEFWSAISDHPHPVKANLLRAANALLIFSDLKIPFVGNVDNIRDAASKLDPRLRSMIVDYKMRDLLRSNGYEFIHALAIDENEAKKKGASQQFWVHAFYSMSISIPIKMARATDSGIPVVAASGGHVAQRILLVGQVLHDIAKYLESLPAADNKDMGCEIVKLAPLFDLKRCDEGSLSVIGFDASAWDETWTSASGQWRMEIVKELSAMGARIAAIVPNYWLFSRGYSLPKDVVWAFKEYHLELKQGPTSWDSFRNFGRWFSGIPPRNQAVIDQEVLLVEGMLRSNKMGFLNIRVLQQYADDLHDAVKYGDSKTAELHKQAKKMLRRELYQRAQRREGPGIHIPDNKILQKMREELKNKEPSIPSVGTIVDGVKLTPHMILYTYPEHERHKHKCNHPNAQAQKVEAYRYIEEHNNAGTLTIKALVQTLKELCCYRWKLGMPKPPFPNAVPSTAETLCDEAVTWVLQQLVILAGGMGQAETEKTRAEVRSRQRAGLIKYVEEQAKNNVVDLVEIKVLIEAMSWYTWQDFCAENAMGFLPSAGCTKLVEQLKLQMAKQAQPLRDYIIAQVKVGTLSMAGVRDKIDKMPWYDWSYLQNEPALAELKPLAGATLLEQIRAKINIQLEPFYQYIRDQKAAGALSLGGIEMEIKTLRWYSWDEFKKQAPVDFLSKAAVFSLYDQVIMVIEEQLTEIYDYIKKQKSAGTFSFIDLEHMIAGLTWYSWEEFKQHRAVDWLPNDYIKLNHILDASGMAYDAETTQHVNTIFEQIGLLIQEQDKKSRATVRAKV